MPVQPLKKVLNTIKKCLFINKCIILVLPFILIEIYNIKAFKIYYESADIDVVIVVDSKY